jgi:hypothetical protein
MGIFYAHVQATFVFTVVFGKQAGLHFAAQGFQGHSGKYSFRSSTATGANINTCVLKSGGYGCGYVAVADKAYSSAGLPDGIDQILVPLAV